MYLKKNYKTDQSRFIDTLRDMYERLVKGSILKIEYGDLE